MGRPSSYTEEAADQICDRLAGGESLKGICGDEGMPSQSMVFRWLEANESFRERYARAREAQADVLFDEILDIADDGRNDWIEKRDREGENVGWRENGEAIRRSALRVDARKWMAAKLQPKKYGDKQEVALSGKLDIGAADAAFGELVTALEGAARLKASGAGVASEVDSGGEAGADHATG